MFLFLMAHNPPREWFTKEHMRQVQRDVARTKRQWHSLSGLADLIASRAAAMGRNVVLSPGTAEFVARVLRAAGKERPPP